MTLVRFLIPAVLLIAAARMPAVENVIISEFLASNNGGLRDEDGDFSDWVEIFNGGTNAVNMDGWFLTDAKDNLTRWRFPATNIGPSRFLIVFASGKNRAVPGAPLHANFGLSANGEYVALVKPDGATIASEFEFPGQLPNISYGIGQDVRVTPFVSNGSPARVFIPTNNTLGTSWTAVAFSDASWQAGTNGVGYETYVPGFAVKNIRANVGVCDLGTADGVLMTPAQQAAVFTENRSVINYLNTGTGANFSGDVTFPGFTINVDENNFVTEATGIITIPSSGSWTFGVNSDDGFRCTIGANEFSYPPPRGPADTYATFNLAAGEYPVRLVFYECGGGAEVEFFAAQGVYTGFNAAFRLVGNTPGGGLAVKSLPISGASGGSIRPLIATDVLTQMRSRNASAYIRLPFNVGDPAALSSLTLRMKYDDGFVAYLNGVEVARRNAPATPQWNSAATTSRATSNVLVFEDIDLTSRLGLLQSGSNVLAFQGLNVSASDTDFLVFAELVENKVLGLSEHYFATPTPGGFNSTEYFAFVENLKFDPGRGWFANTNLSVTITSATPGITIRYTRDGSIPSATNGFVYTGPIAITNTMNLRAVGLRDGFEAPEIETHTYIFLDQVQRQSTNVNYVGGSSGNYTLDPTITQDPQYRDTFQNDLLSIPTLSITATWEDMFGPNGVWSNPTAEGVAWERKCSLEYMRPDGEDGFHINCGVRIQGGVSRTAIPKHGLRVLFKSVYGKGKLKYDLYPDSPVKEFDTLTLHGFFNDHWLWVGAQATMQRDQWCRDAQNAMGGYGPHGTYVHLYINGLYWGLYNVGEKGDGSYAAHYLGGDKEEYDAFNSDELIDGDANAWNAMFGIANAGITNDVAYTNLSQYLDVPNFIDYMMMNFYAANTDWPWHNWNAARRRVPGAGFHFFCWDAEWTFNIGSGVTGDLTGTSAGSPGVLYAALRAHPEFRRQFGDHAQKHLFNGGALTPGPAQARWVQRMNEIQHAIPGEAARWDGGGGAYTSQTWANAEAQVLPWFPQRTAILIGQLRAAGLYPQLNAPAFAPAGGLVPPGYALALTNPNPSGAIYFTLNATDPRLWGGAIASGAQMYSTPIVLSNATALRARVLDGANWSALVEANFYIVQDFSGLKVTEIMYNPPDAEGASGDEFEFLELKNTGTNALDLSGLQFTRGITFSFTNGTRLGPGAFFVLARNAIAMQVKYPGVAVNGLYTGKLDNGGETLELEHLLGAEVFSFRYDTRPPWPVTPDGFGFSLVPAIANGDPGAAESWRPSANMGGSPGADDPPPNIPTVFINEILTHTDPPQVDAIELHNPTAAAVDVGSWFLSDDVDEPRKFRIPNGTTIAAGGYLVFTEADFNPNPGVAPSFALSSLGESLYLFSGDAATNLTGYNHGFEFGAAAAGVSFGRVVVSTGEEQWPAQSSVTLGAANSGPRIGPLVINEIMYHPAVGYDEFIEIYNLSSTNVPLSNSTNGWKLNGLGYTFSTNTAVGAGGFLLLVPTDPAQFRAKYSIAPGVQILGPYSGVLQDSGERLRLERPDTPEVDTNGVVTVPYIVVDEVRYNDKLPWPLSADGEGPSLQRRAPTVYGNEPTNWFASGITPGAVNVFNQAPLCTLTAPTNGASFNAPVNIALTAAASDPDGTVIRVEFFADDIKVGEATSAPFSFIWSNAPVGTHTLVAKARDNGLAVTPSAPATIIVNPPPLGTGIGLRADYYDNIDFTGTRVRRIDPTVNFDWGVGSPDPAIGADTFSARWLGMVQPRFSETYTFYTVSDDGVRLWVNNQLIIDNWTDHAPTENSGLIALQAGQLYDVKMDMYESGGGATAELFWSAPSVAREIIPSTQLYPPAMSNLPPTVTLTSPVTNAVFVATSTIDLTANALDPDGAVFKVEFFAGAAKLGEDSSSPFGFAWTNVPAGSYALRAVATDDSGIARTSAPVNITIVAGFTSNFTFIATGAVWRYRDTGENPGNAWTGIAFNDTGWSNGAAQLGYGDGDERTTLNYGPDLNNKYITSYFRRAFVLQDIANFSSLALRLMRDDGAVVYLNGSEIYRSNMPGGAVNYLTLASVAIGGTDESTFYSSPVNPGYLVPGTNIVAVEIHQSGGTSSDISFDFELTGAQTFVAPAISAQPQPLTVTEGDAATLAVAASGTAPLVYQWRFNGTNLPGATSSVLAFPSAQRYDAGNYRVLVSNRAGSATSQVATLTVLITDTDRDGMPDQWELANGLDPNANDAALDPDGDGMTNLEEYVAGTDPRDPESVLKVAVVRANGWFLQFNAISNISYTLQARPSLSTSVWQDWQNIGPAATNRSILLPISILQPPSQFYRAMATR